MNNARSGSLILTKWLKEEKSERERESGRERDLLLALGEGLVKDVTVLLHLSDADHLLLLLFLG